MRKIASGICLTILGLAICGCSLDSVHRSSKNRSISLDLRSPDEPTSATAVSPRVPESATHAGHSAWTTSASKARDNSPGAPTSGAPASSPATSEICSVRAVGYQSGGKAASEEEELLDAVPEELGALQARLDDLDPTSMIPSAESPEITLESLIDLALANNPALQQSAAAAAKASGVRTQVGLKPNLNLGYFGNEIGNGGAAGQHGAFLSQTFVRGNKLILNREVVGHDVNIMRWQVQVQRQRIATDVRIRYYRILAAQQRLEEAEAFREEAKEAARLFSARLEAAEAAVPDLLQSQILVDEVNLTIRAVELEWRAAWQELAALCASPNLMKARLSARLETQYPVLDLDILAEQIAAESPLLKAALARVDRTRTNLQRQRQQPIPNLQAQAGVAYDDDSGDDFANLQLSLPVPIKNRNQGNIRAAYADYCEAVRNVERVRMEIRLNLADALRRYDTARARAEKYQDSILPKAQRSLELIRQAQAAGEAEFLRVLTARQSFFEYNQDYLFELGQLAQVSAEIDGLLLTGGLSAAVSYEPDDGLRGQALSNQ